MPIMPLPLIRVCRNYCGILIYKLYTLGADVDNVMRMNVEVTSFIITTFVRTCLTYLRNRTIKAFRLSEVSELQKTEKSCI